MKIIFSPLSLSCGCYQIPSQLKHKCLIKQPGRSWEIRRITQDWEWHFTDSPHYSYQKRMKTERPEKLHNTGSQKVKDNQTGYCKAANNSQSWDISQPKFFRVWQNLTCVRTLCLAHFFIVNHFTVRKNKNLPWVTPQSHKTKLTWVMKFSFTLS